MSNTTSGGLPVVNGGITILPSALPCVACQNVITAAVGAAGLTIQGANQQISGPETVISGNATFLTPVAVPVTGTATLDADGSIAALTLRFTLVGATPGSSPWSFGTAFPSLPPFLPALALPNGQTFLDDIALSNAAFVLTTATGTKDAITGVPLQPGLNFVGVIQAKALVGLLEAAAGLNATPVLYGSVVLPLTGQTAPPLQSTQYPWSLSTPAPGLTLQADLDNSITLAGSKIEFSNTVLRLYSPPSQEWLAANPAYCPTIAVTGTLSFPTANISVDLTGSGFLGTGLRIAGLVENVSLSSLADLADLGSSNLESLLPQDIVSALGGLSLEAVFVGLASDFSIELIVVTVGMTNATTGIVSGFTLENVAASFAIVSPFSATPETSTVTLLGQVAFGGTTLDAALELPDGFLFAYLTDSTTVSLSSLFSTLGLPSPPPLEIASLSLEAAKSGAYMVAIEIAPTPGWTIPLGPTPLTIENVFVTVQGGGGGATQAELSGTLVVGTAFTLDVAYNSPGAFLMSGSVAQVTLSQIVSTLTDQSVTLPTGFDLTLTDSSVLIQEQGGSYVFQLATTVSGYGTFALEVTKQGSAWGFAAGLNLGSAALSSLPGLSALSIFSGVTLSDVVLVASSFADPTFAFPAMSAFNNPSLTGGNVTVPSQGVLAGLNLFAQWTLGTSRQTTLLQKVLGLGSTLDVIVQVGESPETDSRLYLAFNGTVEGLPLQCDLGLEIENGTPTLFLSGTMQASIQGSTQTFKVDLAWVTNGAFITGSMEGSVSFQHLTLSNLLLSVGVDYELIPSVGVAAEITDAGFDTSFVVLFNSTNPSQSVLAGAISTCTLKQLYDAFTDGLGASAIDDVLGQISIIPGSPGFSIDAGLAGDLDGLNLAPVAAAFQTNGITLPASTADVLLVAGSVDQSWFITDLTQMHHYQLASSGGAIQVSLEPQFYFAPEAISIGGYSFKQGIFIDAGLEVFGMQTDVLVQIEPSQGLFFDATLSPITLGDANLFNLTAAEGGGGPQLSVSTFQNSSAPQGLQSPHVLLNGKLTFLGASEAVYVNATAQGFALDLSGTLLPGIDFDLDGSFGSGDLTVSGTLGVSIGTIDLGPLGTISIDDGVSVTVDVSVSGSDIQASLAPSYTFAGSTHTLSPLQLDVTTATLANLPAELLTAVENDLKALFTDAAQWAQAVGNGFIQGVQDVESVLVNTFNKTEAEAEQIINDAQSVCALSTALMGL